MQVQNSHENSVALVDKGLQFDEYTRFCKAMDHTITYTLCILEDCYNINPLYGRTDYLRDKETLSRRFSHEGLSFLTKTMPSLFDGLLRYLEDGISDYPGFRCTRDKHPVFLRQLFSPIYEDHTSEEAVMCVEQLYQLCVAFKKLKGPYRQGLLIKQLDDFVTVDQSLDSDWSESDKTILFFARTGFILPILKGLNPFDPEQSESFLPRPGPGATNTARKPHERFRPHVWYDQLSEGGFTPEEWYAATPTYYRGFKTTSLNDEIVRPERDNICSSPSKGELLSSRFKFVHKTFGKPRCICIEELEMQWLQQGMRNALYDRIENHPLSKGYVSFTDQSVNGLLALQSSRVNGEFSTIDMSAASDRVSRKLVEYLFQDNKELLQALLSLSTRIIELPRDIPYKRRYLWPKKYAPMGSALCFPVMGLVHYALISTIISIHASHIKDKRVWVYGDDIILSTEATDVVMEYLPRFGMKLNRDKSFTKSLFRESCGVHAYNGKDITPVRFKSIVHYPLSANLVITALKDEANLYRKGYRICADFIRREILKDRTLRLQNLGVVDPNSSVLGWIREDDEAGCKRFINSLQRRWISDLHCFHYKARVLESFKDDSPPVSDEECYLRKQVTRSYDARKIDGATTGLIIRWRWLPASAFYGKKNTRKA